MRTGERSVSKKKTKPSYIPCLWFMAFGGRSERGTAIIPAQVPDWDGQRPGAGEPLTRGVHELGDLSAWGQLHGLRPAMLDGAASWGLCHELRHHRRTPSRALPAPSTQEIPLGAAGAPLFAGISRVRVHARGCS